MPPLLTSPPTDSHLLERFARSRDEEAFATLMQRHWGFVFSVAKNSLSDSSLAEDATQQTFIALSKRAAKLSKNTPLAPWLYRAVRHESSNLRRREQRLKKRNHEYASLTHPSHPDTKHNHLSTQLHRALAALPDKDRQLILLRFYQSLTADQIADQLSISPAAAQRRTHRALEKLSVLTNTPDQDQKSF
ncbi:MAG: RNA polymerase sigma factor (sigma-70 family), partial [Akkermansiaceae bacterium]